MKQLLQKISVGLSAISMLVISHPVFAQLKGLDGAKSGLTQVGSGAGLAQGSLPQLVGGFINAFLGVLGIVFVLLVVYAGILYMTAAGDTEKVKKAKTLLIQAVIGIIIIVSAYAISNFIIGQLVAATT